MRSFDLPRAQRLALIAGGVGLLLCIVGAIFTPIQFFRAYLVSFIFWSGLALGSMSLILLHHLVGGNWGFVTRRLMEAATRTLPLLAVLLIPLLFGIPYLYLWAQDDVVAHNEILHNKAAYLNEPFFIARLVLYFVIWLGLSWLINRWSAEQDRTRDPRYVSKFRAISGPALILHAFLVTFIAIDLLMSLEPEWFSSIFGAILIVGQVLSTLAFCIAMLMLLAETEPLRGVLRDSHFHDLGNLLFAFVVFWAYVEVSQFLIVWSANLPEEVPWYVRRSNNGWQYLTVFIAVFHFVVPFFLLLTRFVKRRARLLAMVAAGIFVMRIIDLYWIVQPALHWRHVWLSWIDLVAPIAIGGLWLAAFFWQLGKRPLLPEGDTRFLVTEAHHG